MARGIPIPYEQLPKTLTNLGEFQRAEGLRGMNTDAGAAIRSAGNVATVDARGFIVAAQAVGDVGRAIAGEGGALMDLQLKQNEAINIRKEHEAMLAMELEQEAISADIANEPDETKWAGIAESRAKKLNDSLFSQPLSPVAKEAISQRFQSWTRRQTVATKISSARRSTEKAADSIQANIIRAVDAGDFEKAKELGRQGAAAGYFSETDLARQEVQMTARAEANAKRAEVEQRNAIYTSNLAAIQADPFSYAIPDDVTDPEVRDRLEREKRQYQAQASSDQSEGLSDRLASGEFKTLADLQAAFPDTMRPTVRKQFEGMFERAQTPGIKARLEADAPQNFARFQDAVEAYDAEGDPEGIRYAQIVMSVKQAMPEELRGEILGPLYRKRPGADPQVIDAPEPLKTSVRDIVNTMFDAGALGKFRVPNPADPTKEMEDPKVKAAAYAKKGSVMIQMGKWLASNPDATPEHAMEVVRSTIAGNAPAIRSSVPRAAASPPSFKPSKASPVAPWEMDLPDGGGPSTPLIPFFLPSDLQSE